MPIPEDARQRLTDYLNTHTLVKGLGTEEAACTIAAINLTFTGELTDDIPECMSLVIGKWIIRIQDAMPTEIRNSVAWKSLLPDAAGTGRDRESDRLRIILGWMWSDVLPQLSALANNYGFGPEWATMLAERTPTAAAAAYTTAAAARAAADAAYTAAAAADAAYTAAAAASAARAAYVAAAAADAAYTAAAAAAASAACTAAAAAAARAAYVAEFWDRVDPCGLLRKLITA